MPRNSGASQASVHVTLNRLGWSARIVSKQLLRGRDDRRGACAAAPHDDGLADMGKMSLNLL